MYFLVDYIYRGQKRKETINANDRRDASKKVKRTYKGAIVTKVAQTSAPIEESFQNFQKNINKMLKSKIKIDEKIAIIRQIAVMTDAGIPIHDVIDDIILHSVNPTVKEVFGSVSNDLNAGKSMYDALFPYKEQLGHIVMVMTRLGETTGNFPEAYFQLADILENMRDNKAKFMKAIRYPITTLIALAIAFTVVIMQVVPKFRKIFENLGADLPIATKFLLNAESFLSHYGLYLLVAIIGGISFFVYTYRKNMDFKFQVDKVLAHPKFYLIGKVVYLSNMYSYTLVFSSLIKAGIPVSEALTIALGVVDNLYIRKKLESISTNIGVGVNLSDAFKESGMFEDMLLQMIRAGESSGELDKMLMKIRDYFNMNFQHLIDNLSAYIEPIMIAMIAGLVLLLALGIFMPMWDLGKAAKG